MRSENDKAEVELAVFAEFIERSGLPILRGSERKGDATAGEPDIICTLESGARLAFELAEACAPEIAAMLTLARKSDAIAGLWGEDGSAETVQKKLRKSYYIDCPIELVLYTDGRTVLPDDVIKPKVARILQGGLGPFSRVWLLGSEVCDVIAFNG